MERLDKNQEWRVIALSSFVVVLFCGLLNGIFYENLIPQGIFVLYTLGFSVLPILLYAIDRHSGLFTKTGGITISGWFALLFNAVFCFAVALSPDVLTVSMSLSVLAMAYACLFILRPALFKQNTLAVSLPSKIRVLASAAVFGIVSLGFLYSFVTHMLFDAYDGIVIEIPHWGGWPAVAAGVFAVLSAYGLSRTQAGRHEESPPAWTLWICFCPLLLFNIQSAFDLSHYDAFVGPAIAVLHGRIPLIDVFCQYGLGYLLFTLAFMVLPNTYAVCASIVSVINISAFIVYLFTLRSVLKNPYHFAIVGVASVFGVAFGISLSLNVLPSALGFRYLPAMLFVYFLVRGKTSAEDRLTQKAGTALLYFNAVWSIECLVFCLLIAGFYSWLKTGSLWAVVQSTAKLIFRLFLLGLFLCAVYGLFFKQLPHYKIYLEYPLNYLNGRHDAGSFTQRIGAFTGRYLFFLPMALVSFFYFYCGVFDRQKNKIDPILNKLYLINFSGVVFFVYVSVHSFVYHIKAEWILFLPAFFGSLFLIKKRSESWILRCLASLIVWVTCCLFACVFIVRVAYMAPSNTGVNDALVYHLIHFKKSVFSNFWYNSQYFCNRSNYQKEENERLFIKSFPHACQAYDFREELKPMISKYYKNRHDALVFSVSALEILFDNHKYHPIFINPINDVSVDETQRNIVKDKVQGIKEGDVVIVDKDVGLDVFQKNIIKMLWEKFAFEKIEETKNLWVFKLTHNRHAGVPWFLGKVNFISYLGKNNIIDYSQKLTVNPINFRNYFDNGDVASIEMVFDAPFFITGVKFWHLFNNLEILKHRFFMNDTVKNFSLWGSMNGETWFTLASEKDYFMNDKKYYYRDIAPIKIQYLRLNVVMENKGMGIPDLEAFGQ